MKSEFVLINDKKYVFRSEYDQIKDVKLSSVEVKDGYFIRISFDHGEIPENIGNLTHLEDIDLGFTPQISLPKSLSKLIHLKTIRLDGRTIEKFGLFLNIFENLEFLDIRKKFPSDICFPPNWKSVRKLEIAFCKQIPSFIKVLPNVEEINFSSRNTQFSNIAQFLANFPHLKILEIEKQNLSSINFHQFNLNILSLRDCDASVFPAEIANLTALQELNLYDCKFQELPQWLGKLKTLKKMTIMRGLEKLSFNIHQYSNLEELNLSELKLNILSIESIPNLKKLTLQSVHIKDNPVVISNLNLLEELDIVQSSRISIPHIDQFINLKNLYLYGAKLENIEKTISDIAKLSNLIEIYFDCLEINSFQVNLENLIKLEKLTIRNCNIEKLPESVYKLQNLRELSFGSTKVFQIPQNIKQLHHLECLHIYNTKISELPQEIIQLINLRELKMGDTDIALLPDGLGSLVHLERLDLHSTKITQLPNDIGKLLNLKYLNIKDTSIQKFPDSIGNLSEEIEILFTPGVFIPASAQFIKSLRTLTEKDLKAKSLTVIFNMKKEYTNFRDLIETFIEKNLSILSQRATLGEFIELYDMFMYDREKIGMNDERDYTPFRPKILQASLEDLCLFLDLCDSYRFFDTEEDYSQFLERFIGELCYSKELDEDRGKILAKYWNYVFSKVIIPFLNDHEFLDMIESLGSWENFSKIREIIRSNQDD